MYAEAEVEAIVSVEVQRETTPQEALIGRILASRHFIKAPLLSAFLSYVCQRSLREGASRISEQEIGTTVFGREHGYDSREDNIVRNYARQLRRRLDDYYATDGHEELLRIQIPKGGYVPLFLSNHGADKESADSLSENEPYENAQEPVARAFSEPEGFQDRYADAQSKLASRWPWILATACLTCALGASLTALLWVWMHAPKGLSAGKDPNQKLWAQLFTPNRDTLVVPADTALVTVEDMNQREYSLTEYLSWSSVEHPGLGFDTGLRIRKYTDIEALEVVDELVRLPEWKPDRAFVRTASKLHVEDLKDDNLIFVGSVYSIPWIQLLDNELNFRLVYEPKLGRAHIENRHPTKGEAATYANQWNGVNETDYAVLALIPNLNHTGSILLLEGLDSAGVYAARDMLFGNEGLQDILKQCTRPDGSLRGFEALLESQSVDSHSTGIRVISIHRAD
ncbi:hypothetical protein GCM10011586_00680 [Silvibacterium dinghuense]|nr:hypothetical protein GCM10011586_00680 [Silvibacterium dinghuense]